MPLSLAQKFRRRRIAAFGGLALALGGLSYFPLTLLAPVGQTAPHIIQSQPEVPAAAELAWPSNAATAIGAVGFPGVLASTGTTDQRSIASITKIITALVVLEKQPLDPGASGPNITFGAADVRYYNEYFAAMGSVEPVRAGLVLTQREVMEAVLIPSANNYAKSMAIWAYGSEAAFIDAANAWLQGHGLTQTVIFEPTGMDPRNVSTAPDLVELARLAMANPTIMGIVGESSATLPYIGEITSSNKLLGQLGIDGIKTGTLDEAGACFLFSADFPVGSTTVTVIGVALGGINHQTQFPQVSNLMETVASAFHEVTLVHKGDVLAEYDTPWNDTAAAVATEDQTELVWSNTPISTEVSVPELGFAADGAAVGTATFTVGDRTVSVPLELAGTIEDPGPLWRLANPFTLLEN